VLIRHAITHTVARAMTNDRTKELGRLGEELAAEHFARLGYRVLARNHRTRYGELDLILADEHESTIVFCEVKSRRLGSQDWQDNLHERKQKQVRSMAAAWLASVKVADRPFGAELRFDAVGVTLDDRGRLVRLDHMQAAF
jgi:putative endonuclease